MGVRNEVDLIEGNRFDRVDLGGASVNQQVRRIRQKIGSDLEALVEEREIDPEMSVRDLIKFLLS